MTFPFDNVRSRRDFPKLLSLIRASAYLHQRNREKDDGIVANAADYRVARTIFEWSYEAGPDRTIRQLLDEAKKFPECFSVTDLMRGIRWGHTKVYELLRRAKEMGCIGDDESRGKYKFLRDHPAPFLKLPDLDAAGEFRFSAESTSMEEAQ
jgi:hypothetical protein